MNGAVRGLLWSALTLPRNVSEKSYATRPSGSGTETVFGLVKLIVAGQEGRQG